MPEYYGSDIYENNDETMFVSNLLLPGKKKKGLAYGFILYTTIIKCQAAKVPFVVILTLSFVIIFTF